TKLMIGNVINETRNIAHSILPPILKQFGILPALRSLAEQIKNQGNINVVFQTYEFSGRLNEKLELALYRIVQEAISNTIRYAEAKNIKIQLIRHPNSLVLIIEDDGKGFDVSKSPDAKGMGLFNIQERAKVFNGNAIINSSPDMGTEIMVEIPLSDNLNTV
ncbi:MAG TPA: ATP-binding protein, partial [Bacteroidia bacterium]